VSTAEPTRDVLVARLVRSLGRTAAQHALFAQAAAAQLGVAPTDLECLALLEDLGPASAGQLAEVLNLTTGAITGVIDRLVAAGFVARESDPSDRRRVIVRPVPSRMADLAGAYAPVLGSMAMALRDASDPDLRRWLELETRAASVLQATAQQLKADASPATSSSAPRGDVQVGSLEFASGARALRICASDDARPDLLYEARFEGVQPSVRIQGGAISVRYRRVSMFELGGAKASGTVALSASVPWRITLRGGAAEVSLDASGLRLQELSVSGGASRLDLCLPSPDSHVQICLEGGLNRVQIQRPVGVPVELRVRGGANRLEFDTQRFGAVGGAIRLASPGWEQAANGYAIEAHGGASRLVVGEVQA
jgi:DNA-binding MarR family transcriptional regulator